MRIGLAVVTYKRLNYLKQCIESLEKNEWGGADIRVVVDDASNTDNYKAYLKHLSDNGIIVITKKENKGVANSKNLALQRMLDEKCDHFFLMEDDILMKHKMTCLSYIDYAKKNKLQHMNFGLHGELNKGNRFVYWEREDKNEAATGISVFPQCIGAFSYYTDEVIQVVGLMDENLKNAWEHVWHTLQISEMGYTTPFWFFADHPISDHLLEEIQGSIDNSSIRPRDDWKKNMQEGQAYIIQKYKRWLPERPY